MTLAGAACLLALSVAYCVVHRLFLAPPSLTDLHVYRAEGLAIRHGWDVYGQLPGTPLKATYPPFAAIVFATLTYLPRHVIDVAWCGVNIGLVVWASVASCRLTGLYGYRAVTTGYVLAAVAMWCEPVYMTFDFGQINLVLLSLILWDFTRPADSKVRGIGVGLATALKVTPAIFIIYLLLTRRFRFALTAITMFVVTLVVSAAIDAGATWQYWTRYVFDVARVGQLERVWNQTVPGMFVRAHHISTGRPGEMLLVLAVLVAGLVCAVQAHRFLGDRWGLPACAVTGLITSPIAWSHHWVWCVPIAALIWLHARAWIMPTVLVFCSFVIWAVPHSDSAGLHLSPVQVALSGWYVYFGLTFLALTAAHTRRAAQTNPVISSPGSYPSKNRTGLRRPIAADGYTQFAGSSAQNVMRFGKSPLRLATSRSSI